jgi:hypothetical protein
MKRLSNIKLTPEERKAIIEFSRRVKKALGKQIIQFTFYKRKSISKRFPQMHFSGLKKNNHKLALS